MSIQALPDATVHTIGASQVLTDAAAVVKELIDNALDANATSIQIEISANSLDVIQLRDNGHGVAPEDRSLVCRRYCTSKIRDLSDITGIGGTSLGFRGEALASAAQLSGNLTVTTRVDGEDIAVSLKIARNGEIAGRDRASHPIGTTVRITSLFEQIPVRKQTALKSASKTLAKVKKLLQCYAFARPSVRFSLRVLKAKNTKDDWIYAPAAGAAKEDAAFKIIGGDCAGQCQWGVLELDGYKVQAFLPRPDAEVSKIGGIGHFVSVDGRPVATTRTTLKQAITKYRSSLRAAAEGLDGVKDPFAWINISCPRGSYDPNIEPAKDDVLFEDGDMVLHVTEALLKQCYPATAKITKGDKAQAASTQASARANTNANDLGDDNGPHAHRSAKRQKTSYELTPEEQNEPVFDTLEERSSNPEAFSDVNNPDTAQDLRNINVSNPWIMAKMNAPLRARQHVKGTHGQLLTPMQERSSNSVVVPSDRVSTQLPSHPPWAPPSPRSSPIRLRRQQEQRIEPTTEEPRLLDIGSDDSVSVVHQDYDDIDPSLADRYKATKRKRYTGWQRQSDPRHEHEDHDSGEMASQHISQQSLGPKQPRVNLDGRMHDTATTPSNPRAGAGLSKRRSNATGQEGSRIMDIREAFSTGIENQPVQANTAREFKPFKPLLPTRRALELADANTSLITNFEREQTRVSDAGSRALVDDQGHLPLEESNFTNESAPGDSGHICMHTTADLPQDHRRPQRTVSGTSQLPLEQIPVGQQINGLVHNLHVSIDSLSKLTRLAYTTRADVNQVSQVGDVRVHFPAGNEPWGTPCADMVGSDGAALENGQIATLESTLLHPHVYEDELTDWRESILEYLAARGELEDGITSSLLGSHLQRGLESSMGEHVAVFNNVEAR